jgi:hypothetical protein
MSNVIELAYNSNPFDPRSVQASGDNDPIRHPVHGCIVMRNHKSLLPLTHESGDQTARKALPVGAVKRRKRFVQADDSP